MNKTINVIGGGLAGCECAYQLSKKGYNVKLYEMKPIKKTPAHYLDTLCELVCSNSLKSNQLTNACGLLKEELRHLDSITIKCADQCRVPAGNALAVNRETYSNLVTQKIKSIPNIEIVEEEVSEIPNGITVIATGPLTSPALINSINALIPDFMYFYDAAAPIISSDSIDYNFAFFADRYGKGTEDYLNCPMTKEEYSVFYNELINAQTVTLKEFEKKEIFDGCMPIEIMAKRGEDTMRFGPLKPVGFEKAKDAYAILQLRAENNEKTMFNLVGFQTNLTFSEQKRVFSLIPALKNAHYYRYGVMHRNTFINSPKVLNLGCQLKCNNDIFFAGQITGVEGYVESCMSGLYTAMQVDSYLSCGKLFILGSDTMMGAIINYISVENKNFQPMNANFGIIQSDLSIKKKNKLEKYAIIAEKALLEIDKIGEKYGY